MLQQVLTATAFSAALLAASAQAQTTQQDPLVQPQTTAPAQQQQVQTPATTVDNFLLHQDANQIMVSNLMNVDVFGATGDQIGNVDDIVIDNQGNVVAIVVGIGGFLGIAQRDVAIPVQSLNFVLVTDPAATTGAVGTPGTTGWGTWGTWGDGRIQHVQVDFTRAQLEAAPEFVRAGETR